MGKPLILLDRDGVLNRMVVDPEHGTIDSPLHPDQVDLIAGVPEALARLTAAGFPLAIVTNQPAAAKNKTTRRNLEAVHETVLAGACRKGGRIASSHICFHRAEDGCSCRKPKPGLLLEAILHHCRLQIADCRLEEEADETSALPSLSICNLQSAICNQEIWMVGDGMTDVQAGAVLGLRTAFLGPRKCDACKILRQHALTPSWWGPDLPAFTEQMLNRSRPEGETPCP